MAGEHVLVVDDEPAIREMLKVALEEDGYLCSTASGYESALRIISDQPFDLMLLDMVMPRHSGMELFRDVRSSHPDIAVVFITAMPDPQVMNDVKNSGAYDYLVKPVGLDELERVVARALERRRARPSRGPTARLGAG